MEAGKQIQIGDKLYEVVFECGVNSRGETAAQVDGDTRERVIVAYDGGTYTFADYAWESEAPAQWELSGVPAREGEEATVLSQLVAAQGTGTTVTVTKT